MIVRLPRSAASGESARSRKIITPVPARVEGYSFRFASASGADPSSRKDSLTLDCETTRGSRRVVAAGSCPLVLSCDAPQTRAPYEGAMPRNHSRGPWRSPAPFWRGACLLVPTRSSFRDGFPSPFKRCESRRNSPPGRARQGLRGSDALAAPEGAVFVNRFFIAGSVGFLDPAWMDNRMEGSMRWGCYVSLVDRRRTCVRRRARGEQSAADRDTEHAVGRTHRTLHPAFLPDTLPQTRSLVETEHDVHGLHRRP